ncbi:MAG: hypothetical protein JW966_13765 [Anaerolineae bacterium]|nr:hypothetical protein [Anaerolineae bacterium]
MKRRWLLFPVVVLVVVLAACGGKNEEGVDLQAAQSRPTDTPVPTAEPTPGTDTGSYEGRLLYLKGLTFEVLDLATGETTTFEGVDAYSGAALNADRTRGVFIAFPNFGILDLAENTVIEVPNRSSNPVNVTISPDGEWLGLQTGTYRVQLALMPFGGADVVNVSASTSGFFTWSWTADSRLVWAVPASEDGPMVFDPGAGKSAPLSDEPLALATHPIGAVSPDGARLVVVASPTTPQAGISFNALSISDIPPDECYDAYAELSPLPLDPNAEAERLWSETGLVASSPQWVDNDRVLFVRLGYGTCGEIDGEPLREVVLIDTGETNAAPRVIAAPLGNADDLNDETQQLGGQHGHLFSPSPDGQYLAWVGGGRVAGESVINITHIATGDTETVVRFTENDAQGVAQFFERYLIRQVVWLD